MFFRKSILIRNLYYIFCDSGFFYFYRKVGYGFAKLQTFKTLVEMKMIYARGLSKVLRKTLQINFQEVFGL